MAKRLQAHRLQSVSCFFWSSTNTWDSFPLVLLVYLSPERSLHSLPSLAGSDSFFVEYRWKDILKRLDVGCSWSVGGIQLFASYFSLLCSWVSTPVIGGLSVLLFGAFFKMWLCAILFLELRDIRKQVHIIYSSCFSPPPSSLFSPPAQPPNYNVHQLCGACLTVVKITAILL